MTLLLFFAPQASTEAVASVSADSAVGIAPESRAAEIPAGAVSATATCFVAANQSLSAVGTAAASSGLASASAIQNANASAVAHAISSLNFLPYDNTRDFSAAFAAASLLQSAVENSATSGEAQFGAQGNLVSVLTEVVSLVASAVLVTVSGGFGAVVDSTKNAEAAVVSTSLPVHTLHLSSKTFAALFTAVALCAVGVPPRGFAVAATSGGGRVAEGVVTSGGGRVATGTVV